MNCSRCQGLMIPDWDIDLGEFLKCVACGARPYQPVADPLQQHDALKAWWSEQNQRSGRRAK